MADVPLLRELFRRDLFALLVLGCRRLDLQSQWFLDRCDEVQSEPDGYLDLWAREHGKSSIITFGLTIQDILRNPEITIGIFSHNRPIAKGFLRPIKRELEANTLLQQVFPDVLWANPGKEAPTWSEDSGIVVKRKGNPKESTVEAWGLVEGMPIGKHFDVLVMDDLVTQDNAASPDMREKTLGAWSLALNLGKRGGVRRIIGTRYHYGDAYGAIIERQAAIPRVYPAEKDGEPVLLSREELDDKRRDMGPYVYCFPTGTPILMCDWTERPIEQVREGDLVVGFEFEEEGARAKFRPTRVIGAFTNRREVIEATFESGRTVQCTPDHKWYTGRRGSDFGGADTHAAYAPLHFGEGRPYRSVEALISVYDPRRLNHCPDERLAAWLGGMFDGEGSASAGTINFTQSAKTNPEVVDAIAYALSALGFKWTVDNREDGVRQFWIRGIDYGVKGSLRAELMRFLNICRPVRARKIFEALWRHAEANGKSGRDKLVSHRSLGEMPVYNIETETGNYVAWGYATKNSSQMQLDPRKDSEVGFKLEWLRQYRGGAEGNTYAIVDPSSGKKLKRDKSDYTAAWVMTAGRDGNWYVEWFTRDRLNLIERINLVMWLHREFRPMHVGYEEYGMQADIEAIRAEQDRQRYRFDIVPLGGKLAKFDRIQGLAPLFEQGKIYFPPNMLVATKETGEMVDMMHVFRREEYEAFPYCAHDDMLDALARITDPELGVIWPKPKPEGRTHRRPARVPAYRASWVA